MEDYIIIPKIKKIRNKYPKDLPVRYKQYLVSATNKKIRFDFTVEEFESLIEKNCHYCNLPKANGIDKINPKGEYTKENSVPCCKMCNTMKFIYPVEDFLEHIKRIYQYNNQ